MKYLLLTFIFLQGCTKVSPDNLINSANRYCTPAGVSHVYLYYMEDRADIYCKDGSYYSGVYLDDSI